MTRKLQIGVIAQHSYIEVEKNRWGDGKDSWTYHMGRPSGDEIAPFQTALFEIGAEIARRGHVVLCERDWHGLSDAIVDGAQSAGGLAISFCGGQDRYLACEDSSVRVMTGGIRWHRETKDYESQASVFACSCDAIIAIGYGSSYVLGIAGQKDIPTVALLGVSLRDSTHDDLIIERISSWEKSASAHSPSEAVELALRLIGH